MPPRLFNVDESPKRTAVCCTTVAESTSSKIRIIYAGEIVEFGDLEYIFDKSCHPYTIGLLGTIPSLDQDKERLNPIHGLVCDPTNLPEYCSFYDRCNYACEACKKGNPQIEEIEPGHFVRCFRAAEVRAEKRREMEAAK